MKKIFNTKNIVIAVMGILLLLGPVGKWLGWDNDGEKIEVETKRITRIDYDTIKLLIEDAIANMPQPTNVTKTVRIPYNPTTEDANALRTQINSLLAISEKLEKGEKVNLDSINIDLPVQEYKDTLEIDGATLSYNHRVAGFLEGSKYGITYPKEMITIHDSIFTTKTITKNRIYDFFLVGGYQVKPHAEYKIGVDFVTKKWKIGASTGYDPMFNQQTVGVNAGIRLFGR